MLSYPEETAVVVESHEGFYPLLPETLEDTGLPIVLVEDLLLKILLAQGVLSGRDLAEVICLPFKIVHPILMDLKNRMLVVHRTTAAFGDFVYNLSEQGKHAAMLAKEYSGYAGAAPVIYPEYLRSVEEQSIRGESPKVENLRKAYADVLVNDTILNTIGPAINSGRGLFLFGEPGNGKTTIAERIRNCFVNEIYLPKTLWIEGEIVQLFDPQNHELVEAQDEKQDQRWVKIKRPTIVVGGELTMESLDIKYNITLKVCEAPLQMKANCGTFLIDDFGRQRVSHKELLNRWIIPLEKRYDFLVLPNGKKIQVPFDELIIFSTNLNPKDLVDDAFLRRIPYKIEVPSPDESEFRALFQFQCEKYGISHNEEMVTYLIENYYRGKRGFRACHPRDILDQVINISTYLGVSPTMTSDILEIGCRNYFSAMECNPASEK